MLIPSCENARLKSKESEETIPGKKGKAIESGLGLGYGMTISSDLLFEQPRIQHAVTIERKTMTAIFITSNEKIFAPVHV
jgi:hypothetical protein